MTKLERRPNNTGNLKTTKGLESHRGTITKDTAIHRRSRRKKRDISTDKEASDYVKKKYLLVQQAAAIRRKGEG